MTEPRKALDQAGAKTSIVSPKDGRVRAWNFTEWGDEFPVDVPLAQARPEDFDAILLPGGVINPDTLRMNEDAVLFAQAFLDGGKPVATICHGPWTLIETGKVKGRRIASWPSLQTDLNRVHFGRHGFLPPWPSRRRGSQPPCSLGRGASQSGSLHRYHRLGVKDQLNPQEKQRFSKKTRFNTARGFRHP